MKKFLIIGSMNAITYKSIFPLIKDKKMWFGVDNRIKGFISDDGDIKNINVYWYTNMEHHKRNEPLILTKRYDPEKYPRYNNYSAIDVSKVSDIPMDYAGVMGVPVTFLEKYSPTQFEIIGCADADIVPEGWRGMTKEFVDLYYTQGNTGQYQEGKRLACFLTNDGMAKVPYKRILIKRVSK